ncbi:MAG: cyclic nucleotide-binding domain-containing protein [Candidatus Xenobia bacterium]
MLHTSLPEPIVLPRGGALLESPLGPIQYGAVPETIKDTMELEHGVPTIFVTPQYLFDACRGMSLAELEFPAYWNTFCRNTRTTIICRPGQYGRLRRLLAEAVFGPHRIDPREFANGSDAYPDLLREMAYFRAHPVTGKPMELEDLVDLRELDPARGTVDLSDGVSIALTDDGGVAVLRKGRVISEMHGGPPMPHLHRSMEQQRGFRPPVFGVTVIGSGHGFDPGNRTSGFVIWIEGRGVMVDPPVDAVDWLEGYAIGPRQIDSLILTHCHADHDAGTLQKLLQEGRVTIYTTPTILASFVAKYSHLMGMEPAAFQRLFDHVPVSSGEPIPLHGAEVRFTYSLHSIPCVGFEVFFRGRSLVYPSDTLNDPEAIRRLRDQGVLTQARARQLVEFPWHHQLVLHEAGIPPIHTPVKVLAGLEDAIKQRLYLLHVSERSLPEDSGLRVAPTGLDNTIDLGAEPEPADPAVETLDFLSRIDIFEELPLGRGADLLRTVRRDVYPPGICILKRGTPGERFYMIESGAVVIYREGAELQHHHDYDYFGETALLTGQANTIEVYARTTASILSVPKSVFLNVLRGTRVLKRLLHLAEMRLRPTWELLSYSSVFADLTVNQKVQLQQLMEPVRYAEGETLGHDPVFIEAGRVEVVVDGQVRGLIKRGGFAGDTEAIRRGSHPRLLFRGETRVQGYRIKASRLRDWFKRNPGVYLRLNQSEAELLG